MKGLRSKASRFLNEGPSQDEKAANAQSSADIDFIAGIEGETLTKKPSRFFKRKVDYVGKPLPAPPADASFAVVSNHGAITHREHVANDEDPQRADTRPTFNSSATAYQANAIELKSTKHKADIQKLQSRPSMFAVRSKGSSLFWHEKSRTSVPPPPPQPQISVEHDALNREQPLKSTLPSPKEHRLPQRKLPSRNLSISRPFRLPLSLKTPIPENPVTVSFTKPAGPPPPRPPRPESLGEDVIALMRDSGSRMVLTKSNRASDSTASFSTPRSQASSIEARLVLPIGHGTPRNRSLDSPLAARFPVEAMQPLPARDSSGRITVSKFSEFVKSEYDGYAGDGLDEADRELGPVEQYDATKEGNWMLEKKVSKGPTGHPGMLFRNRWGAFYFVADI